MKFLDIFKEVSPYSYDSVKVVKIRHAFVKLQRIVFTILVSICLQING